MFCDDIAMSKVTLGKFLDDILIEIWNNIFLKCTLFSSTIMLFMEDIILMICSNYKL